MSHPWCPRSRARLPWRATGDTVAAMGDDDRDASPGVGSSRSGRITIYDVARVAGVSPSTVSRALGRPGRLNADTEARITAVALDLGFRPNAIARALPTGRTRMIGMVIPDLTNPVFARLARGVESAASELDYTLVIAESAEAAERESTALERMLPSVDGVILASSRLADDRLRALARTTSVVLVSRELDGVAAVLPDVEAGVDALVAHLAGLGHRRITYLEGPARSWTNGRRGAVLRAAAIPYRITVEQVPSAAPTLAAGREALGAVLHTRPTAVVAFNDLLAIGLMRAAEEAGVALPSELSVAGFDDIFGAELTVPALTTVRTALADAGEAAARLLIGALGSSADPASSIIVATELVERDSTARPA